MKFITILSHGISSHQAGHNNCFRIWTDSQIHNYIENLLFDECESWGKGTLPGHRPRFLQVTPLITERLHASSMKLIHFKDSAGFLTFTISSIQD